MVVLEGPQRILHPRQATMIAMARGIIDPILDDAVNDRQPAIGAGQTITQLDSEDTGQMFVIGDGFNDLGG